MTDPSTIVELTAVARGLGFEVICPGDREGPLSVRLYGSEVHFSGSEVHFSGTLSECAAFLVGWGTLRSRLLSELCAVNGQGSTEMSGQPSIRGSSGEVLPPMLVPLPYQGSAVQGPAEMSGQPPLRGSSSEVLLDEETDLELLTIVPPPPLRSGGIRASALALRDEEEPAAIPARHEATTR